jgi:2-keto-4-pentenoate hydratase/2-oxohepta-3-ene-1,7-dioic acid hydratase in catechol pathway
MRLGNLSGRLVILRSGGALDVAEASDGAFGPDPHSALERWNDFVSWTNRASWMVTPYDCLDLGPPVPRPRQVFAVALNYLAHAAETGRATPDAPLIFTKFPSCIAGPYAEVALPTAKVDWELELVVVIGRRGRQVDAAFAWSHVAGVMVGQDLSARDVQRAGSPPQFSLGKSFESFGPTGPWLVTVDELADPNDLELACYLNDDLVQAGRTSEMVFDVPALIAQLSRVCELLPGDLIFTGTPHGVGMARDPQVFLRDGDVLRSVIEEVGEIRTVVRSPARKDS